MVHRNTEAMAEAKEARKQKLISAAISIISKEGADAVARLTVSAPEKAKMSSGVLFNYWADKAEFLAAITRSVIEHDIELLVDAVDLQSGIRTWARRCALTPRATSYFGQDENYRAAVKAELVKQLRGQVDSPSLMAAVIYGAVIEAAQVLSPRTERDLVAALFRAMGLRVPA